MSAGGAFALVGAWVLVGFAPGWLVLVGLRPASGWLRNLALAPVVSYGLVMVVGVALELMGRSIEPMTVLPAVWAIGVIVLVVSLARRRRQVARLSLAATIRAIDVLPLGAAVVISVAIWLRATELLTLVPPNDDGSNHGLFATQILHLHTITPDQIVVGDVLTAHPSSPYYPLAIHLVAALVCGLSGATVASALTLQVVVAAGLLLPVGMFILTRRLFPAHPGAASAAAVLALCFPAIPYYLATWGGFPFIIGMAAVPIVVDAAMGCGVDAGRWSSAVVGGLALVGVFAVHSSEAVTAVVLAALLGAGALLRHERPVRDVVVPWGLAFTFLVVFVAAQWGQISAGTGNVATAALIPPQSLHDSEVNVVIALTGIPDPRQTGDVSPWLLSWHAAAAVVLWLLTIAGAVVAVRRRWSPEWVVGLVGVMALTVASSMRLPGIDALTVPWYSRWDRMVLNEVFFLVPLAALGTVALAGLVARPAPRRAVAGGVIALVACPQVVVGAAIATFAFAEGSLATPDQRMAFAWLAEHTGPGERVLNDSTDGSSWMWALNDVPPLFATAPHQIDGWGDRLFLQRHAAQVGRDRAVTAAANEWGVRYAYVGPRVFPAQEAHLSVEQLQSLGGWRPVFSAGGNTILERTTTSP